MEDAEFSHENWVESVVKNLGDNIAFGAVCALDFYGSRTDGDIETLLALMDADWIEDLSNECVLNAATVQGRIRSVELATGRQIVTTKEVDSVVESCLGTDFDWHRSLHGLRLASQIVENSIEQKTDSRNKLLKPAAMVAWRIASQDPIGGVLSGLSLANAAANWVKKGSHLEKAIELWDLEIQRFAWSTLNWRTSARESLEAFLKTFSAQVFGNIDGCTKERVYEQMVLDIELMETEFDERPKDLTVGMENNTCPRCGISYSDDTVWCDGCEVSLQSNYEDSAPEMSEIPLVDRTVCPSCSHKYPRGTTWCSRCEVGL